MRPCSRQGAMHLRDRRSQKQQIHPARLPGAGVSWGRRGVLKDMNWTAKGLMHPVSTHGHIFLCLPYWLTGLWKGQLLTQPNASQICPKVVYSWANDSHLPWRAGFPGLRQSRSAVHRRKLRVYFLHLKSPSPFFFLRCWGRFYKHRPQLLI